MSPPEKMSLHLLTAGWKYFQLLKIFIYTAFLKHWIMTKNQKKNTPSSKPYRTDFFLILLQNMTDLQHLVLAGNKISQLDHSSIPHTLRRLHLGHNNITHLNGTLR